MKTTTANKHNRKSPNPPPGLIVITLLVMLTGNAAARSSSIAPDTSYHTDEPVSTLTPDTLLPESPTLDDYLRVALHRNPELRSQYETWQAEIAKTGYAGALPDPMIMFAYMVEPIQTRVGPQEQRLGASQKIPWLGELRAEKAMASASARAALRRFEATRLAVTYRTTQAYYDYWNLGRQITLMRDNLQLLTFWEEVVRTKYQVALSTHPDVIKAQVELGKIENEVLSLEDRLTPVRAELLAELNLPPTTELPLPADIDPPTRTLDESAVLAAIDTTNPSLQALCATVEREAAGVRVAKSSWYPDLTVGVDYFITGEALDPAMTGSGADPWMVSAAVNVPLWFGKNKARVNEARARERAAQYNLTDSRNNLLAYASTVMYQYRDARRQVDLYRNGLMPKAEQALNAAYTAYQSGELDFLNVLDAQRQLLDFQLAYDNAAAAAATRLAELEMLTGGELSEISE